MIGNRRSFTSQEKLMAEIVTGQIGEADHITPYSLGGETDVTNLQIIPASANKKKGSFAFKPRGWQKKFLEGWENRKPATPFMLIATPGSGKTMAALEAARRWRNAGADRKIVVVVPTDSLRTQWQKEALQFGLQFHTKEFNGRIKADYAGAVVTYHFVGNNYLLFKFLCSNSQTMVIFDEVHHCGEDKYFGVGIKEGFELAKEKLLMSGTPWKTDGEMIPFVRYDTERFAIGDYCYSLTDARKDNVVRQLVFNHSKGTITNEVTGAQAEVNGDISETEASERLRTLLDARGNYVAQQIVDSHRKLIEIREKQPDAGALAICIDQTHAEIVAGQIKHLTGCDASIVLSDEYRSNDTVASFNKSSKEWIVAVKKVSEGVDIKRLQVLCYLTNVTSELFFRQAVGRVSRVRDLDDHEGFIHLPADPRLIAAAKNIENAQVQAAMSDDDMDTTETPPSDRERNENQQMMFSTSHEGTDTILVGNESIDMATYKWAERIGAATNTPIVNTLAVLRAGGFIPPIDIEPVSTEPLEEKEARLRRATNKKVNKLVYLRHGKSNPDHGKFAAQIHAKYGPSKTLSITQLEAKDSDLDKEISGHFKSQRGETC